MVWSVACLVGAPFTHYAPIAGAFWEPLPEGCLDGSMHMRHTHGTSDTVVPIAGRPIGQFWHQGDMWESLDVLGEANACALEPAVTTFDIGPSTCESYACAGGGVIEICLHDGGHSMPRGWSSAIRDWIEATAG